MLEYEIPALVVRHRRIQSHPAQRCSRDLPSGVPVVPTPHMTTPAATPPEPLAPPTGNSVLQALSFGFRVLAKPDFLWAPILLAAIQVLPLAFVPAFADPSTAPTTPEEAIAFFRAFLPALAAALLAGLIVGPILTGGSYRLGSQFLRGEEARPFGAELPGLAWRIFLQQLILTVGILLLLFASVAVIALIGDGAGAVPVAFLVLLVLLAVFVAVFIRVAVAIPLTLEGAGPVEALRRSWQLTAGHARWGCCVHRSWRGIRRTGLGAPQWPGDRCVRRRGRPRGRPAAWWRGHGAARDRVGDRDPAAPAAAQGSRPDGSCRPLISRPGWVHRRRRRQATTSPTG